MKLVVIIGSTGSGKTTKARELITGVEKITLVYDLNHEEIWEDINNVRNETPEFFIDKMGERPGFYVFEDASAFFSTRSENPIMKKRMIKKRHNKQFFILLFHSIAMLPNWILPYVDSVYIGNTNDKPSKVREFGYKVMVDAFDTLRNGNFKHKFIKCNLKN